MKRQKRKTLSEKKRRKLSASYRDGGGDSQYARKHAYCSKHGVWGFEIAEPKPWKKAD